MYPIHYLSFLTTEYAYDGSHQFIEIQAGFRPYLVKG